MLGGLFASEASSGAGPVDHSISCVGHERADGAESDAGAVLVGDPQEEAQGDHDSDDPFGALVHGASCWLRGSIVTLCDNTILFALDKEREGMTVRKGC